MILGGHPITLEHRIVMSRLIRDWLDDVPVLDYLAVVIESEDIDASPVCVAGPMLIAVQDHMVALGDNPAELDVLPRILTCHTLKVGDEGFLAVSYRRIVLDVDIPNELLNSLRGSALVEHQVIEGGDRLLVLFEHSVHLQFPLNGRLTPRNSGSGER